MRADHATRSLAALGLHAQGGQDARITGLSVDSRAVAPGHLFAALPGAQVHGAAYAGAAVARGAAAVLTDRAGLALAADALAVGYPLTVHGTGGQTRAFIHIQDTCRCVELALINPPAKGDRVNILNQMTETHRVRDLAAMIADQTGAEVAMVDNPRNEAAENDLHVTNDTFLELGLNPITLEAGLMAEATDIARRYAGNCDRSKIPCVSRWR